MNENAIVEELYEAIKDHGLMNTLVTIFGKGAIIEMGFSKTLCETEVKDLENISVRSYNGIMRAGCKTIGQLIEKINDGSLIKIRQLGIKSVAELRTYVVELGYAQMSDKRKKEFLHHFIKLNGKEKTAVC